MKLTKSQSLMKADGAPSFLFVSTEQRKAAWDKIPLRAIPEFASVKVTRNEDEATAKFRADEEARRKAKQTAHFDRLKAKKNAAPVDYNKMRWDARRNKFVPMEPVTHGPRVVQEGANLQQVTKTKFKMVDTKHGGKALVNITPAGPVVDKSNAEAVAKLNGVWKASYSALTPGLMVMTVKNRLKKIAKVVMP